MNGEEFRLIKELTYSRLTAICAFKPPFFAYLFCGSLLNHGDYEKGNLWVPIGMVLRLAVFRATSAPLYKCQFLGGWS